jgi:hypothetical protein
MESRFTIFGVDDLIPGATLTCGSQDPKNPVSNLALNKITKRYRSPSLSSLNSWVMADLNFADVDRSMQGIFYLGSNLVTDKKVFFPEGPGLVRERSLYRIRNNRNPIHHRTYPDAITFSSNYSGSVANVQQNPADTNASDDYLFRVSTAINGTVRFSFPNQSANLKSGNQYFYIKIKETSVSGPSSCKLYENGVYKTDLLGTNGGFPPITLANLPFDLSVILTVPFDPAILSDPTGNGVELQIEGPINVEAVMWMVEHVVDNDSGWLNTTVPSRWKAAEQEFYIAYYPPNVYPDTNYVLVEWSDPYNNDFIHQAGKLIASSAIIPDFNLDWSPSLRLADSSEMIPNASGSQESFRKKRKKRGLTGTLDDITQVSLFRDFVDGLLRAKGTTGTFFYTWDSNCDPAHLQDLCNYCRLVQSFEPQPSSGESGSLLWKIPNINLIEVN